MNTNLLKKLFFLSFRACKHIHLVTAGAIMSFFRLWVSHFTSDNQNLLFSLGPLRSARLNTASEPFHFRLADQREKFSHGTAANVDTFGSIQLTFIQMEFKYDEGSAERISFSTMTKVHSWTGALIESENMTKHLGARELIYIVVFFFVSPTSLPERIFQLTSPRTVTVCLNNCRVCLNYFWLKAKLGDPPAIHCSLWRAFRGWRNCDNADHCRLRTFSGFYREMVIRRQVGWSCAVWRLFGTWTWLWRWNFCKFRCGWSDQEEERRFGAFEAVFA